LGQTGFKYFFQSRGSSYWYVVLLLYACHFFLRDAMQLWSSYDISVRPSVTLVHFVEMVTLSMMPVAPDDSSNILVS